MRDKMMTRLEDRADEADERRERAEDAAARLAEVVVHCARQLLALRGRLPPGERIEVDATLPYCILELRDAGRKDEAVALRAQWKAIKDGHVA